MEESSIGTAGEDCATDSRQAGRDLFSLLLAATAVDPSEAMMARVREALSGPFDWLGLLRTAGAHDVLGLLCHGLDRIAPEAVPDGIRVVLELDADERARRAERVWAELVEILSALERSSIAAIPFKGPVLARLTYGDAGLRGCEDLDFLVRDADIDETIRVLQSMGYRDPGRARLTSGQFTAVRRLYGQWSLSHPARLMVEPHTTLAPSTMAIDLDHESLWSRARTVTFDGTRLRVLSPEDHLLMLAIHGGKETWSQFRSVTDVDRLLATAPHIDWDAVWTRARDHGLLRMVRVALALARRAFRTALPEEVDRGIATDRAAPQLARTFLGRLERQDLKIPPMSRVSSLRFRLRERWSDRVNYAARTILTPRFEHYGMVRLPDRLIGLYVIPKLVHDYVLSPLWKVTRRRKRDSA